jgi:hypothetical protein
LNAWLCGGVCGGFAACPRVRERLAWFGCASHAYMNINYPLKFPFSDKAAFTDRFPQDVDLT